VVLNPREEIGSIPIRSYIRRDPVDCILAAAFQAKWIFRRESLRRGGNIMKKQNSVSRSVLLAGIIVLTAQHAGAQVEHTSKGTTKVQFLNPAGLSKPMGYTQVVVAQSGKLVYVSGQVPLNASGEVVGKGDLRAQVTQVMNNLKTALAAAGATMNDVVKVNYYVVNLKPEQVPVIREVRSKYFSAERPPAGTLVGVTALVQEGYMIEIEAEAAVK
jgi:enamine deaminase RidA (YjgF/YER057c/UK114 family)